MLHVLTEIPLDPPLVRASEAMSLIARPQAIRSGRHARMVFLLDGVFLAGLSGQALEPVRGGDIIILPEGTILRQQKDPDSRGKNHFFFLFFHPSEVSGEDSFFREVTPWLAGFRILRAGQTPEIRSLLSKLREESSDGRFGARAKMNALARCLVVEVVRNMEDDHRLVPVVQRSKAYITNQAKEFVAKNFRDAIRLSDVAQWVNLSEEYLCRIFRAETGTTLFDFINAYRVECSKEALLRSTDSVSRVGELFGFSSGTLFARQFRRHAGMTPTEYRMAHGGKFGLLQGSARM